MFIDRVEILVESGKGGDGCVSFRREKYVPRGGPDGGDGGDGGSVILRVDERLNTLLDLTQRPAFSAKHGRAGQGKNRKGAKGADMILAVPPGTVVKDADTERVLRDMTKPGMELLVVQGGKGGRGNKRFASATNRTPREAEQGGPGQARKLVLELKLIADVGLIGLPNAGKSTLLSRISSAHPKVADYPFTTTHAQLGIVSTSDLRRVVVADIPGLIEGAHQGVGLGHEFLRHIERTRILAHLVDIAPSAGPSPREAYETVRREMALYSPALVDKPEILVANKMDLTDAEDNLARLRAETGAEITPISAVTGRGIPSLVGKFVEMLFDDDSS